jgi:branched-subunit amino acid transport protein
MYLRGVAMTTDKDLKEIRRKIYLSFFQDGLWDILLGFFLLGWGVGILTEMAALIGGWVVIAYSAVWGIKRWLTYPRVGVAVVPQARKTTGRLLIAGIVVLLIGVMAFVLVSAANTPDWLGKFFIFIFGAIIAAVVCMIGYWWSVNRWYVYAALVLAGAASHQWLGVPLEYGFITPGTIIILSGLVILLKFLRRYPRSQVGHSGSG